MLYLMNFLFKIKTLNKVPKFLAKIKKIKEIESFYRDFLFPSATFCYNVYTVEQLANFQGGLTFGEFHPGASVGKTLQARSLDFVLVGRLKV